MTQFATGFGFSLVAAPLLIAAYRAPTGVQLTIVLSVNLALLAREHRGIDSGPPSCCWCRPWWPPFRWDSSSAIPGPGPSPSSPA